MNNEEIIELFGDNLDSMNLNDFRKFVDVIHELKLDWFKTNVKNEIARFGLKNTTDTNAKFVIGSVDLVGDSLRVCINRTHRDKGITSIKNELLTNEIVDKIAKELRKSKSKWPIELKLKTARNGYWPKDYDSLRPPLPLEIFINFTKEEIKIFNKIQDDRSLSETEKQTQIKARVGQGEFRNNVIERAGGKCEITGVADKKLLIASHIHAWAKCKTYKERLDGNNGLLLSPSLDKLFDKGYISFDDKGVMLIKSKIREIVGMLVSKDFKSLKLTGELNIEQRGYLKMHRAEHSFPEMRIDEEQ